MRLVDALAKCAASRGPALTCRAKLLDAAAKAARHAAMLLGRVTHAANNLQVQVLGPDGKFISKVRRDASQADRGRSAPRSHMPTVPLTPSPFGQSAMAIAHMAPSAVPAPLTSAASGGSRRRSSSDVALARRVAEIGASLSVPSGRPTAVERLRRCGAEYVPVPALSDEQTCR